MSNIKPISDLRNCTEVLKQVNASHRVYLTYNENSEVRLEGVYLMDYDNLIKRIVIVGNGFDLAHGLKTSYRQFAQKYIDHVVIKKFHQYVDFLDGDNPFLDEEGLIKNIEWYSFELNMERLIKWNYKNEINSGGMNVDGNLSKLNNLFTELERLLKKYLVEECSSQKVTLIESVQDCFDEYTLAISFNYTDTIKLYTNRYYYVHGSLSDDKYIIIGFATGDLPCLCSGDSINFLKDVRKEELSYLRYLTENGCNNIIKELDKFKRHAVSLFSGKGEYDLEYKNEEQDTYDTTDLSSCLKKYAEKNRYAPKRESYDYTAVEEIVVMGHGLEADLIYLTGIFEKASKLDKVILYSYDGENGDEIERKIKVLKRLSGFENIIISKY